jgi:uncharacterized protein (DUF1778 family)
MVMVMANPKAARFEARLDPDDDALLSWAARQTGMTKSGFVLGTALERARELQARERVTLVGRDEAEAFLAWLDEPPRVIPEMQRLLASEPFEQR